MPRHRVRARTTGYSSVIAALAGGVCLTIAAGRVFAQPAPGELVESCVTQACHSDILGRRVMHGPVAQQKCEACHILEDARNHRFAPAADVEALCGRCHSISLRTFVHEPVRQGDCTGCHDPHGSDHHMMLRDDPTRGLCGSCHADMTQTEFVHGPVAAGACILCHDAHSSWHPGLLTQPSPELCLGCHAEVRPDRELTRSLHAPVKDDCGACHDPHGSNTRYQLHEPAPELCLSCHDDVRTVIGGRAFVHGALTQDDGCRGCHAAHSSPFPALQRATEIELCLGCHDRPIAASDGRTLTDMAALLDDNPSHHGPIRDGACSACHQPHAAEHERLLHKAYPPEFYAPFTIERYELCFSCHIPDLVREEHGTGLTRFREGDRNLHWLHVNREKGRTCRACHEVHASRNPFHIRDAVPFGNSGWALEIGYQQTESGGSCAPGCHVERSYDRDFVADADASPASATRRAGAGEQP